MKNSFVMVSIARENLPDGLNSHCSVSLTPCSGQTSQNSGLSPLRRMSQIDLISPSSSLRCLAEQLDKHMVNTSQDSGDSENSDTESLRDPVSVSLRSRTPPPDWKEEYGPIPELRAIPNSLGHTPKNCWCIRYTSGAKTPVISGRGTPLGQFYLVISGRAKTVGQLLCHQW